MRTAIVLRSSMKVFLDATILYSGSQENSRTESLLHLLFERAACVTNEYAIDEARRNLEMKSGKDVRRLRLLVRQCEIAGAIHADLPIEIPQKDVPILGGAIVSGATHLLTGDERHFGAYFGNTIAGVKIVPPRMLADTLVEMGWL